MKKLFENKAVMSVAAIVGTISGFFCAVLFFFDCNKTIELRFPIYLLQAVLVCSLYLAYQAKSKDLIKGLLGALLSELIIGEWCYVAMHWGGILSGLDGGKKFVGTFVEVVFTVLQLILFVNHFVINSDRHGSPKNIKLNQIVIVTMALVLLFQGTFELTVTGGDTVIGIAYWAAWLIFELATLLMIVCMETRVDMYHKMRDEKNGFVRANGEPAEKE